MKIAVSLVTCSLILVFASLTSCDVNETSSFNPSSVANNYEVSSSNGARYSWDREGSCRRDMHDNILLRKDSLYVEGKVHGEWGQFARKLKANEMVQLEEYIHEYSNELRAEIIDEECGGLTSLYIKKGSIVVDSVVDAGLEWREKDIEFLTFIARLVCAGELKNLGGKEVHYPSERMVVPPPPTAVQFKFNK